MEDVDRDLPYHSMVVSSIRFVADAGSRDKHMLSSAVQLSLALKLEG